MIACVSRGVRSLLIVCALFAAAPISALAERASRDSSRSDVATTRAYLLDMQRLARSGHGHYKAELAAIHQLIAGVRNQCPKVLAGAPETNTIWDFRFQMLLQVAEAASRQHLHALMAFTRKVKKLHWRNRKLTYYVHGSAEEAEANAAIVPPSICSEAQAIVAGGYQKTPPRMARYQREITAANGKVTINVEPHEKFSGGLQERIQEMLKPYERPSEKRLVPKKPSPAQEDRAAAHLFAYVDELLEALGLTVPPQTKALTHA